MAKKSAARRTAKKGTAKRGRKVTPATKKAKKSAKPSAKAAKAAAKRGRGRPKGSKDSKKTRGGKSARKPRVSLEIKRDAVARALKKYPRGVALRALRTDLEKMIDPKSKSPVFSTPDFNSAEAFGKRLLPTGWKIQGTRREARAVKK